MSKLRKAAAEARDALEALRWGLEPKSVLARDLSKLIDNLKAALELELSATELSVGIHYDVLQAYAEKHNLDYNELCRTVRQSTEPRCGCGDRPLSECPGEWEPGCDLGSNERYAVVSNLKGI